jgi:hypothetical protein
MGHVSGVSTPDIYAFGGLLSCLLAGPQPPCLHYSGESTQILRMARRNGRNRKCSIAVEHCVVDCRRSAESNPRAGSDGALFRRAGSLSCTTGDDTSHVARGREDRASAGVDDRFQRGSRSRSHAAARVAPRWHPKWIIQGRRQSPRPRSVRAARSLRLQLRSAPSTPNTGRDQGHRCGARVRINLVRDSRWSTSTAARAGR